MAIQIKHATTAVGTEAGDGEIGKTEWNEAHTLTLETSKLLGRTTAGSGTVEEVPLLDEDDMVSDSATSVPTQQSVKAYVDAEVGAIPVGATGLSEIVEYTSSGTFTKASYTDAKQFIVTAIGPGGDGGIASSGGGGNTGGGGGGGGVAVKRFVPADIAASITITINASSATFAHTTAVVGNTGADASSDNGGAGGTATGGDQNYTGQAGGNGRNSVSAENADGAVGGSTWNGYGNGGAGGMRTSDARNGHGYGGGGGGAGINNSGIAGNEGTGAGGAVIIEVRY